MWIQVAGADVGIECVTNNNRQMRWVMTRRINVLLFFIFLIFFCRQFRTELDTLFSCEIPIFVFCTRFWLVPIGETKPITHTHTLTHTFIQSIVCFPTRMCFTSGFNGIWMVTIADAHVPRTRSEKVDQHISIFFSFSFFVSISICSLPLLGAWAQVLFLSILLLHVVGDRNWSILLFFFYFAEDISLFYSYVFTCNQSLARTHRTTRAHGTVRFTLTLFSFFSLLFLLLCNRNYPFLRHSYPTVFTCTAQARMPIGECACRRVS